MSLTGTRLLNYLNNALEETLLYAGSPNTPASDTSSSSNSNSAFLVCAGTLGSALEAHLKSAFNAQKEMKAKKAYEALEAVLVAEEDTKKAAPAVPPSTGKKKSKKKKGAKAKSDPAGVAVVRVVADSCMEEVAPSGTEIEAETSSKNSDNLVKEDVVEAEASGEDSTIELEDSAERLTEAAAASPPLITAQVIADSSPAAMVSPISAVSVVLDEQELEMAEVQEVEYESEVPTAAAAAAAAAAQVPPRAAGVVPSRDADVRLSGSPEDGFIIDFSEEDSEEAFVPDVVKTSSTRRGARTKAAAPAAAPQRRLVPVPISLPIHAENSHRGQDQGGEVRKKLTKGERKRRKQLAEAAAAATAAPTTLAATTPAAPVVVDFGQRPAMPLPQPRRQQREAQATSQRAEQREHHGKKERPHVQQRQNKDVEQNKEEKQSKPTVVSVPSLVVTPPLALPDVVSPETSALEEKETEKHPKEESEEITHSLPIAPASQGPTTTTTTTTSISTPADPQGVSIPPHQHPATTHSTPPQAYGVSYPPVPHPPHYFYQPYYPPPMGPSGECLPMPPHFFQSGIPHHPYPPHQFPGYAAYRPMGMPMPMPVGMPNGMPMPLHTMPAMPGHSIPLPYVMGHPAGMYARPPAPILPHGVMVPPVIVTVPQSQSISTSGASSVQGNQHGDKSNNNIPEGVLNEGAQKVQENDSENAVPVQTSSEAVVPTSEKADKLPVEENRLLGMLRAAQKRSAGEAGTPKTPSEAGKTASGTPKAVPEEKTTFDPSPAQAFLEEPRCQELKESDAVASQVLPPQQETPSLETQQPHHAQQAQQQQTLETPTPLIPVPLPPWGLRNKKQQPSLTPEGLTSASSETSASIHSVASSARARAESRQSRGMMKRRGQGPRRTSARQGPPPSSSSSSGTGESQQPINNTAQTPKNPQQRQQQHQPRREAKEGGSRRGGRGAHRDIPSEEGGPDSGRNTPKVGNGKGPAGHAMQRDWKIQACA